MQPGDRLQVTATRKLCEKIRGEGVVRCELGMKAYDLRHTCNGFASRYFVDLDVGEQDLPRSWTAGEADPASEGKAEAWKCRRSERTRRFVPIRVRQAPESQCACT